MPPRKKAAAPPPAAAPPAPVTDPAPLDRALLQRVHLFPVRHHSPRASATLRAFLDEVRPRFVLVEGPADATPLIDVLVDNETAPPVALLAYRVDQRPDSALWPFAAYSPEYAALRWAAAHRAEARFIDLQAGQALAAHGSPLLQGPEGPEPAEPADAADPEPQGVQQRLAAAYGCRSFEELWEAQFEAPAYAPQQFRDAVHGYADLVRREHPRRYDQARDAVMARHILAVLAAGAAPEQVVVVLGGAHAAALRAGDVDPGAEAELPAPVPCALTLIPFSFPRLAAQLGYGAGNRAPQYYQRAHDAGCDFRRAALEVLLEFTERLRQRGFAASLADTIEAYRLAIALAELRGKPEPGLDELREAATAALCRGEAEPVDALLAPTVLGHRVGRVARRIGQNSLQEEFWREVRARRLPESDASSAQRFHLHLADELQRGTSVFLHRLRVSGVPYASYLGSNALGGARLREGESAGGLDALTRHRESWSGGWSPATETALVEKIVLGDTLEQVSSRVLEEQLAAARGTGAAAAVMAEALLVRSARLPDEALRRCEELAAVDDDVVSLAAATRVLAGLLTFGVARLRPAAAPGPQAGPDLGAAVATLGQRLFLRAALRAPAACQGDDEAVTPVLGALRTLHDVALGPLASERDAWLEAARGIARSYAVHPRCAGFACALLFQAQLLADAEVIQEIGQRLSGASEPLRASSFLEGFFQVNAALLVRNRAVVQAIDAFLCHIPAARFREALPPLRRAFAPLQATERRYLLENLIALRGLFDKRHEARAVLREQDQAALKAMDQDLGQVLADLDDLL